MTAEWDKSKLPSRHVTVGPERAPHRSYYYAMGLSEAEIADALGISCGTVKSQSSKAMASLRTRLGKD